MSEYSPSKAKVTAVETMPPDEAKWITLKKINYTDPSGKPRVWETAERQTRAKGSDADAVGVIAILNDPTSKAGASLLLQKQFRPPLNKVTIEVPSGLIDEGESAADAAIRELKEETGYVATLPKDSSAAMSFLMYNDPGFTNTNTLMTFVDVDMNDERNKKENLKQELEGSEFIETFTIPLSSLWEELTKLDQEGFAIDARVGTLAQGMEVAKKWKTALGM